MSEILFIANDSRILALIENLQSPAGPDIGVEADYSGGIKRIFDEHPSVVFLQGEINEVSCEKPASQVKMLLGDEAIRLVLLSEGPVTSFDLVSAFDSCFDINLPLDELSQQVRQQLPKQEAAGWSAATAAPAVLHGETMEFDVPAGQMEPFGPFPAILADAWGDSGAAAPYAHIGALGSLQSNTRTDAALPEFLPAEDPHFPDYLLADELSEPLPAFLESAPRQEQPGLPEPSAKRPAAALGTPVTDFHRIEREHPNQLFGSLSEAFIEPSSNPAEPGTSKPYRKDTSAPTTIGQKSAAGKAGVKSASSVRPATRAIKYASPYVSSKVDELSDSVALEIGIKKSGTRSYLAIIVCVVIVLCIASIAMFFWYYGASSPATSKGIHNLAPMPLPLSATQQLPQFIPRIAPDASYGATHPGWESYHDDAVQYLVYREKGQLRAIQVLSEKHGAITLPFLKTCIRVATGHELPAIKTTEARNGFKVGTGTLQNGGEVVIYRKVPDDEIRGFVVSFPSVGQAEPSGVKATAR